MFKVVDKNSKNISNDSCIYSYHRANKAIIKLIKFLKNIICIIVIIFNKYFELLELNIRVNKNTSFPNDLTNYNIKV